MLFLIAGRLWMVYSLNSFILLAACTYNIFFVVCLMTIRTCGFLQELRTATGGLVTKNNVASFHWTSPELLAAEEFSRNTDIW